MESIPYSPTHFVRELLWKKNLKQRKEAFASVTFCDEQGGIEKRKGELGIDLRAFESSCSSASPRRYLIWNDWIDFLGKQLLVSSVLKWSPLFSSYSIPYPYSGPRQIDYPCIFLVFFPVKP